LQLARFARSDIAPLVVLAAGILGGGLAMLLAGRGLTFYYDEWSYVVGRAGHAPSVFLEPHNEHPSIFPVAIYKLLFDTVGLAHYWVYRFVHILLMELLAVLVYLYGRPRIGRWWALFPAMALVIVGGEPEYVLWPFELSFSLSLIGAVGAALAFDRGTRRWDVAVVGLWLVSLFSSGVGITLFVAFVLEVILRGDRRRRAWVVAAPALLYALWWIPYHAGHYPLSNVQHMPGYVEGEYTAGTQALTTLSALNAPLAAALVGVTLVAALGVAGRRPRFWFIVGAPVTFWCATALVRYGISDPDVQRYAYPSAVLIALVACELGAGRMHVPVSARAAIVAGLALVALVVNNIGLLHTRPNGLADFSHILRPEIGALELARGHVAPDFVLDANRAPDIVAGRYFAARDRYPGGSPGDSPDQIARATPDARVAADAALFRALQIGVTPAAPPATGLVRPQATPVGDGAVSNAGAGCVRFEPHGPNVSVVVAVPGSTLYVDNRQSGAPVTVSARRFADTFSALGTVDTHGAGALSFPTLAITAHPLIAAMTSVRPFRICTSR